ncbi:MAG: DUF4474 domain-containing protein [Clostridia bacterium]|nr:DUF4474 domain-containing protein [Clostridia bacterium]
MRKNLIIYILVGAIAVAGLATGIAIAVKKLNTEDVAGTTETTTNFYENDFSDDGYTIAPIEDDELMTNADGEVIELVTDAEGNTFESVLVTDVNGEVVTDENGEKVTAATKPAGTTNVAGTTKKPASTTKVSATKKPSKPNNNSSGGISTGDKVSSGSSNTVEVDKNGNANIVKPDGTIAMSYSYDAVGNYFYTDDDPWQRNFGFNRVYDMGAIFTVMYLDTIHVYYNFGDYDWMVQFWKGQYGFLFVGAEIGLYYKDPGKSTAHYNCAEEDMEIMMQMTVYREGYGELFTRPYASHWWITAFVPGKLEKFTDRSELTMVAKLTFKSEEEAKVFCSALEKRTDVDGYRFKEASSISKNRPETYVRKGATVDLVWRYLDDDRVNPRNTTTAVTTTKPVVTTTAPSETTKENPSAEQNATTETTTQRVTVPVEY